MAAVRIRAAAELRRRWRATVLLAVLVGLTGGVVLAAVAGARRTATVTERFLAYHQGTNVAIEAQGLDTDALRRLPMVADVAEGGYLAMVAALPSGEPDLDAFGEINPFVLLDDPWPGASNRPIMVAGRLPSGDRPLEMVVDETLADRRHLKLGDTLRMWAYSPAQVEGFGSVDQFQVDPLGGAFDLTVTGVIRTPYDLAPVPTGQDVAWLGSEELYLSPAFWRAYQGRVAALGTGSEVRLRNGLRDLDAFAAAVRRLSGGRDAVVQGNSDAERTVRRLERAIRIEVATQLVFAALAALTGLLVIGQSIARQVQLDAAEYPALRALGRTSGQLTAAVLVRGALVGLAGALLAGAVAVLLSPLTPIGLARRAEVDPGVAADAPVLVLGAAGLLLVVLARTGLAGWAAARASGAVHGRQPTVRRPSRVADGLAGAGGPPSAVIGTRLAFESGQSAAALSIRTAAVGAVVAVAAVAAALTFGSSLGHLAGAPALQGWAGDALVGDPRGPMDGPDRVARRLAGSPLVAGYSSLTVPPLQDIRVDGVKLVVIGVDQLEGDVLPPALQGHQVRSGELTLGPASLRRIDREVGNVVELTSGDRRQRLRIVGTTLLQSRLSNDLTLGSGALLTLDDLRRLVPDAAPNGFLVEYAPGADPEAAFQSLRRDFGRIVLRPLDNEAVENLARVGGLPYVLAGLLALLGVGTIGHTLVSSVRHRRRDLAVLKTIGFVRGQVRATVAWQATGFAALAVVVGIPSGSPPAVGPGSWSTRASTPWPARSRPPWPCWWSSRPPCWSPTWSRPCRRGRRPRPGPLSCCDRSDDDHHGRTRVARLDRRAGTGTAGAPGGRAGAGRGRARPRRVAAGGGRRAERGRAGPGRAGGGLGAGRAVAGGAAGAAAAGGDRAGRGRPRGGVRAVQRDPPPRPGRVAGRGRGPGPAAGGRAAPGGGAAPDRRAARWAAGEPAPPGRGGRRVRGRDRAGAGAVGSAPGVAPVAGGDGRRPGRRRRARPVAPPVPGQPGHHPPADGVGRAGRGRGRRGGAGGHRPAGARRLAAAGAGGGGGGERADPLRPGRRGLAPAGRPGRPPARPHGVARRPERPGRRRLPAGRARSRPGAERARTGPAAAVDGRRGGVRPAVPPGPRTAHPGRQPAGLRRTVGARRGPAHLRGPAVAGHPARGAAAAAGRVAPQDHGPGRGRGLDRLGGAAGTGRLGARPGPGPAGRRPGGGAGGGPRRGLGPGLAGHLAAEPARRPRGRGRPGGPGGPLRRAARPAGGGPAGRRALWRGGRSGPGRAGPPGRPGPAQRAARLGAAGLAGRAAAQGRGAAGLAGPDRVAADAERRRIERDLHDGAQQRLVALAVKLRLARRMVDGDLDQARGMLDELRDEVKDAVEELRSLAHGIYPPLLLDQGLAAALGSAAQRATIPTRVEAGPIGRYPADVEAAAYFCCLEALQNAMKYAGAEATVVIRAWEEDGTLRFAVTDDGAGFDPAAKAAGTGFVNMGDRLGAIGGTLQVASAPGAGTSVLGTLPLSG